LYTQPISIVTPVYKKDDINIIWILFIW